MLKKDTLIIVASVLLFIILAALLFSEMQDPEGGVEFISNLFGGFAGN